MVHQQLLPGIPPTMHITNVASVPQRSPFRYPGGKTWLVPRVRRWLLSFPACPSELIEPFAGGGIVGLTAAFEHLADHVTLVELDEQIAAVWQTMFSDDGQWLAEAVSQFNLTEDSIETLLGRDNPPLRERALQTIIKNRINRGGILANGAGRLKYGENGKGISSRWYPETLKKRISQITSIRDRFSFVHGDGLEILRQNATRDNAVFFIDPPYTADGKRPGSRLYTHFEIDHNELFRMVAGLSGDFLMTYDNVEGVRKLAERHGFDTEAVAMKNTHHAEMTELLIGRDLAWLR